MDNKNKLIIHILDFGREFTGKWYNKYLPRWFVLNEMMDIIEIIVNYDINLNNLINGLKEYYLLFIDRLQDSENQDITIPFKIKFCYEIRQCFIDFKF